MTSGSEHHRHQPPFPGRCVGGADGQGADRRLAVLYTGAWAARKRRALSMDVLIALGTSVAHPYSVVVITFVWRPWAG